MWEEGARIYGTPGVHNNFPSKHASFTTYLKSSQSLSPYLIVSPKLRAIEDIEGVIWHAPAESINSPIIFPKFWAIVVTPRLKNWCVAKIKSSSHLVKIGICSPIFQKLNLNLWGCKFGVVFCLPNETITWKKFKPRVWYGFVIRKKLQYKLIERQCA